MKQLIHLQVNSRTKAKIDAWQHRKQVPTRAAAIRQLVEKGLGEEIPENETQDMRIRAEFTKQYFMPVWEEAMAENYQMFKKEDRKQNMCLSTLIMKHKNEPCICVASGPSLDNDIPYLKKWKGIIICGPTNCSTLKAHDIEPDYVCAYDAGKSIKKFIDWQEDYSNVTLVSHLTINHSFLAGWPGPKKYYLNVSAAEEWNLETSPLSMKEFIDRYQIPPDDPVSRYVNDEYTILTRMIIPRIYTNNKYLQHGVWMQLMSVGSTGNNEMMVACVLGCKPIGLAGHDLGVREGGNLKFTKWLWDRTKQGYAAKPANYKCTKENHYGMKKQRRIRISDNGMITSEEMISYKMSALINSFHRDNQFFELAHAGEFGIWDYFPKIEIAEFVDRQGRGYESLYLNNAERYYKARDYYESHGQGRLPRPPWLNEDDTVNQDMIDDAFGGMTVDMTARDRGNMPEDR